MLGWSFSHMGFVMGGYGLLALGLTAFMMKVGGTIFKHLTTALIQGMMSVLHFGAVRLFNSLQAALSWIQDEAPHVVMMMDVGESGSFGDADMARLNAVVQRANQIKTRGDVNLMVIDHANTAASIAAITNILRNTSALSMRVPMSSQLKNADGLINDDAVLQQAGADFVAVQSVLSGASNKNSIEMVSLNPALHVRSSRLQTILILITQILGRWMVLEKGYLGNMIEAAHLAGVNA